MAAVLTNICKYAMLAFIILYTIVGFSVLGCRTVKQMKPCFLFMSVMSFFYLSCGFVVIALNEKSMIVVGFYAAIIVYCVIYVILYRIFYPKANLALLAHQLLLMSLGLILLTRLKYTKAFRQYAVIVVSSVITLVVPRMFARLKAARVWAGITGAVGLLLLAAVLLLGREEYGAKLAISYGSIRFQPSEFVKISFVLLMAVLLRERTDFKRVLLSGVIALAHGGVLILSKDLGSALIFFIAYLMMLFVATSQPLYLLLGGAVGTGAAVAAYHLFSHVQVRIQAWQNPWPIFSGRGNQIGNSLFGISTGGWAGMGLYGGMPGKIPVVEEDFIFAAVCEELGGITGICVILICLGCLLMFVRVAAQLYLPFYRLTGIGLATIYGVQVFLTIAGSIRLIPSTGVTLPLVSYGANSVLSTMIILGIMQELYIKHQNEVERIGRTKKAG